MNLYKYVEQLNKERQHIKNTLQELTTIKPINYTYISKKAYKSSAVENTAIKKQQLEEELQKLNNKLESVKLILWNCFINTMDIEGYDIVKLRLTGKSYKEIQKKWMQSELKLKQLEKRFLKYVEQEIESLIN